MFNDRLRRILETRKISQSELAEALKCTRQNVSDWLAGRSYPKYPNLIRLAGFAEMTIEELLVDEIKEVGIDLPEYRKLEITVDEQELVNIFRSLNTKDRLRLLKFAFELNGETIDTPNSSTVSLDWGKNKLKTAYTMKPEEEKTEL